MKTVGFYVKAGIETGYGHIVRCLALADELKQQGIHCFFCTNDNGVKRAKDYDILDIRTPDYKMDIWVLDLEDGIPLEIAQHFRPLCEKLVILNGVGYPDGDPGRLLADLVFYQGVTNRPAQLDWTNFTGQWFIGPEYLILRDEFRERSYKNNIKNDSNTEMCFILNPKNKKATAKVLIAGGGSDAKGVTSKVIDALMDSSFDCDVIIGPEYKGFGKNACCMSGEKVRFQFWHDPQNVAEIMSRADVAVVSYGMTAFECLALGIPTVALSISPDHKDSADLVELQSGCALDSLGEVDNVHYADIQEAVYLQLARQAVLSKQAQEFVDGRGAERVAELILE